MLEIRPLPGAIGAELLGLDPRRLPCAEAFAPLRHALAARGVLLARGLDLDEVGQLRITEALGRVETYPQHQLCAPGSTASVIYMGERPRELYLRRWHSDHQFQGGEPPYTLLYAIQVPERGGETQFAHLAGGYARLSRRARRHLDGQLATHRFPSLPDMPTVETAAVRHHPLTGAASAHVSQLYTRRIGGLGRWRSRALVARVARAATRPGLVYTHRWQSGDLLIWDNLVTMHRRLASAPGQPRLLRRTQCLRREEAEARDGGASGFASSGRAVSTAPASP